MSKRKGLVALIGMAAVVLLAAGLWRRSSGPVVKAPGSIAAPGARAPRSAFAPLELERGGARLDVVVLSAAGAPVAAATVAVTRQDDVDRAVLYQRPRTRAVVASDGRGRCQVPDLAAGRYAVTATMAGTLPALAEVTVASDESLSLELRLGPAGVDLTGKISDSGGGPIAGARLIALGAGDSGESAAAAPVLFVAASGDDGGYRMSLRRGRYDLRVEAEGYAGRGTVVVLEAATARDFRLTPAGTIAGRVIDRASGQPVADAEVSPRGLDGNRGGLGSAPIRSDAAGAFQIAGLRPGGWVIEARKDRLTGVTRRQQVASGAAVSGVQVVLDPGLRVAGQVLGADGQPARDAEVLVWAESFPSYRPVARTDAEGRYAIDGVLPGRYNIWARRSGGAGRVHRALRVLDRDLDQIVLKLVETPSIKGVVVDGDAKPVSGVTVLAQVESGGRRVDGRAISDSAGRFNIENLPAGQLRLNGNLSGIGTASYGPAPHGADGSSPAGPITLRLEARAGVQGTVRYRDGAVAAGALVQVWKAEGGGSIWYDTRTDGQGKYLLRGLDPGANFVRAARAGGRMGTGKPDPAVTLAAGQVTSHDLTVDAGASIRGRVTLSDGTPAAGALVLVGAGPLRPQAGPQTTSDADGRFTIEDLEPKARYTLWAELVGRAEARSAPTESGTADVELRLDAEAVLAGRVVDGSGKPVVDFDLQAMPGAIADPRYAGPMDNNRFSDRIHDPEGRFELRGLAAGPYELRATAPNGAGARQPITVAQGEQKRDIVLTTMPATTVRGRVVDAESDRPLAGVTVAVWGAGAATRARTGNDGAFVLEDVPGLGVVSLSFSTGQSQYVPENETIILPPDHVPVDLGTLRFLRGDLRKKLEGGPAGLTGLEHQRKDGKIVITTVRPNTAAAAAGLQAGDQIVSIDGQPVQQLGQGARGYLLIGKPKTDVAIVVSTAGGAPRSVTLTRRPGRLGAPRVTATATTSTTTAGAVNPTGGGLVPAAARGAAK